eukprot:m.286179 g.286179  ORF g.286179 m.286179 type:complete len:440 (-) comp27047_c0_seq4:240-1559(-)
MRTSHALLGVIVLELLVRDSYGQGLGAVVSPVLFKSVFCTPNPGYSSLPTAVNIGSQSAGYCTVHSPDLQTHSSNRALCTNGAFQNICALARWTAAGSLRATFVAASDYVSAVLYVNDGEVGRFLRDGLNNFTVDLSAGGVNNVSLYLFEDCCAGTGFPQYRGWSVTVTPLFTSTAPTATPTASPTTTPTAPPTSHPTTVAPTVAPSTTTPAPSSARPTTSTSSTSTPLVVATSFQATSAGAAGTPTALPSTVAPSVTGASPTTARVVSNTSTVRDGGGSEGGLSSLYAIVGVLIGVAIATAVAMYAYARKHRKSHNDQYAPPPPPQALGMFVNPIHAGPSSPDYEVPTDSTDYEVPTTLNPAYAAPALSPRAERFRRSDVPPRLPGSCISDSDWGAELDNTRPRAKRPTFGSTDHRSVAAGVDAEYEVVDRTRTTTSA